MTRVSPRAISARRRSNPSMSMASLRQSRRVCCTRGWWSRSRVGWRRSSIPGNAAAKDRRPGCAVGWGRTLRVGGDLPGIRGNVYRSNHALCAPTTRHAGHRRTALRRSSVAHLEACDHCGAEVARCHSCRNGQCPKCETLAKERWLEARCAAQLLPVPHFHVLFTLPHENQPLAPGKCKGPPVSRGLGDLAALGSGYQVARGRNRDHDGAPHLGPEPQSASTCALCPRRCARPPWTVNPAQSAASSSRCGRSRWCSGG